MFLVPTGILAALVAARGDRVAASTCARRCSRARCCSRRRSGRTSSTPASDFFGTMVKSYPPGVHQEMIFEVAERRVGAHVDHERARRRSRARTRSSASRRRPTRRAIRCCRRRSARRSPRSAAPRTRHAERDELIDEFRENNHAIEAIDTMESALGAGGAAARAARRERHDRDGRRSRARNDDAGRRADPPRIGTPGAIQGPRPRPGAAQRRDLRRARLLGGTRSRRSPESRRCSDARSRASSSSTSASTSPGPFGPMILGDLGADVIKVEPVTGDGMRLVNQAFFGCSRGKRDIALNLKDRARSRDRARSSSSDADIVHHNMTAGVADRLGIAYDDCKRGQRRRRLLQHVGVRPRRSARALRRSRPALPGRGRPRVRSGAGARGQHAALPPLRDDRHRERDAVGRRLPRRAVPPAPDR